MSEETPQIGEVRRYFLGDTLGSSNLVAGDSGSIVAEYSYVLNNPLRHTDPSGYLFKELATILR